MTQQWLAPHPWHPQIGHIAMKIGIHFLCVIHRHRHYRQFAVPEKGLNLFVSLCFFVTTPPLGRPNGRVVLLLTKVSHINPWQVGRTRSHIGTVSFSVFSASQIPIHCHLNRIVQANSRSICHSMPLPRIPNPIPPTPRASDIQ